MTLLNDTMRSLISSPDYVNQQMSFSATDKTTILTSNTFSVLASIFNSKVDPGKTNRNTVYNALADLKITLRTLVEQTTEERKANNDTIALLQIQLSQSTVLNDIQTINKNLPSSILLQDTTGQLNYTIPNLTTAAMGSIEDIVELNYRYNQALALKSQIDKQCSFLIDLMERVDSLLFILENLP